MQQCRRIFVALFISIVLSHSAYAYNISEWLGATNDYPLPGNPTRWDYMSLDAERSQLFIAHLGDSSVVVVNTKTKAVTATIDNIKSVHGILVIPELNRVYASATGSNQLVVIDATSLKILARIPTGFYPDGMAYAPEVGKLYVSNEFGKTETVIDTQTNQPLSTISLSGDVGNTQYDPVSKHIFVNVQGTKELIEIDPRSDKIIERIKLTDADANHGLLIDSVHRIAFIACEGNNILLVLDLQTKKVVAHFNVSSGPDVLAYDQALGILYVASESGMVSAFSLNQKGVVKKIGEHLVGSGAHTLALDASRHEIYFPVNENGHSVLRVLPSLN